MKYIRKNRPQNIDAPMYCSVFYICLSYAPELNLIALVSMYSSSYQSACTCVVLSWCPGFHASSQCSSQFTSCTGMYCFAMFHSLQLIGSSGYGVLNITLNPICSCRCTSQAEVVNISWEAYCSLWLGSIFQLVESLDSIPYLNNLVKIYATSALLLLLTTSVDHILLFS